MLLVNKWSYSAYTATHRKASNESPPYSFGYSLRSVLCKALLLFYPFGSRRWPDTSIAQSIRYPILAVGHLAPREVGVAVMYRVLTPKMGKPCGTVTYMSYFLSFIRPQKKTWQNLNFFRPEGAWHCMTWDILIEIDFSCPRCKCPWEITPYPLGRGGGLSNFGL